MQRFIALLFFLFAFGALTSAQQLSDDQVIQYVKEAQRQGKTQKQMTAELATKGVTAEQVERIKNKYQNQQQQRIKKTSFHRLGASESKAWKHLLQPRISGKQLPKRR
jgi:SOS response regulatory protein OraA/RecX